MKKLTLLPLVVLLALAGCGGDDGGDSGSRGGSDKLTVLAASSLTEVFTAFASDFEADHDGVEVVLSFGSSTDLAESAADGAPGDVLATADEASMQVAQDAQVTAQDPVPFATNKLVIVTAPGNPDGIASLADLDGTTWVRCADDVPCGRVAVALLDAQSVTAKAASLEPDVKSTLEKVTSGEADAGLVYSSDAIAAGAAVDVVEIDGAEDALTTYFIAALAQSSDATLASDWIDLVTSEAGQQTMTDAGFTVP
ncbi:molybdate ABC transporter substrate-binding protein [Nocardioides sp.]|uniref:molybdate ABC transporter substrate-binding protein n=1 Tax=Nocardioides sp. TaxID=35761 RepID=UPI003D0A4117